MEWKGGWKGLWCMMTRGVVCLTIGCCLLPHTQNKCQSRNTMHGWWHTVIKCMPTWTNFRLLIYSRFRTNIETSMPKWLFQLVMKECNVWWCRTSLLHYDGEWVSEWPGTSPAGCLLTKSTRQTDCFCQSASRAPGRLWVWMPEAWQTAVKSRLLPGPLGPLQRHC
jgi:hypothetical protein